VTKNESLHPRRTTRRGCCFSIVIPNLIGNPDLDSRFRENDKDINVRHRMSNIQNLTQSPIKYKIKAMPKKINKNQPVTYLELEKLLTQQTTVILGAVDERIIKLEIKIDKKIEKMEERINKKFDRLTTTLDRFLKRMTDMEDEFRIMKGDINRMKKIISEKLSVDIL